MEPCVENPTSDGDPRPILLCPLCGAESELRGG